MQICWAQETFQRFKNNPTDPKTLILLKSPLSLYLWNVIGVISAMLKYQYIIVFSLDFTRILK